MRREELDMEPLQIKYFMAVAQSQHIAQTAKQLNVSQPAISLAISRLEQELGVKLFNRVGRNIVLNEYGAAFYEHANKILREEKNIRLRLEEMKGGINRHICLAMTSPHLLDGIMLNFIKQNPDIKWKIKVVDIEQCVNLLKNGQIDFCMSSPAIYDKDITTTICTGDKLLIAVSQAHPFARKSSVTLTEVLTQRLITLVGDNCFRRSIDDIFKQHGLEAVYHIECDHTTRNVLIAANQGISITVSSAPQRGIFSNNICFIPIKDDNLPRIPITLCHMQDRYLNKYTAMFIQKILEYYKNLKSI